MVSHSSTQRRQGSPHAVRVTAKSGAAVLGLIENMTGFSCDGCRSVRPLMPEGNLAGMASDLDLPVIGRLPFDPRLAEAADRGTLFVHEFADAPLASPSSRLPRLSSDRSRPAAARPLRQPGTQIRVASEPKLASHFWPGPFERGNSRSMKFAILESTMDPVPSPIPRRRSERAESAGYESLWTGGAASFFRIPGSPFSSSGRLSDGRPDGRAFIRRGAYQQDSPGNRNHHFASTQSGGSGEGTCLAGCASKASSLESVSVTSTRRCDRGTVRSQGCADRGISRR